MPLSLAETYSSFIVKTRLADLTVSRPSQPNSVPETKERPVGQQPTLGRPLTKTAVPVKKGCWTASPKKDKITFEAFLFNDCATFE